jgi:hypothetical protein
LFASLVLLTAAAKKEKKKRIKTGASSGHIPNLKQPILETFDIYETIYGLSPPPGANVIKKLSVVYEFL